MDLSQYNVNPRGFAMFVVCGGAQGGASPGRQKILKAGTGVPFVGDQSVGTSAVLRDSVSTRAIKKEEKEREREK